MDEITQSDETSGAGAPPSPPEAPVAPAPEDYGPVNDDGENAKAEAPPSHLLGQLVSHTAFDPYAPDLPGGGDVTRVGIVGEVGPDGCRIAWLELTDPIPADELTTL